MDNDMMEHLRQINDLQTNGDLIKEDEAKALLEYISSKRKVSPVKTDLSKMDFTKYQHHLGWIPLERVEETFRHTTQLATNWIKLPMQRHFKSRFPQLNCPRLQETYSTDTFFSSVKDIGGETCAQLYVGNSSMFTKVYGMAMESQGNQTLEDFIAEIGASYHIHSDNAQMEQSKA